MRIEPLRSWRRRPRRLAVFAVALLAVCGVAFPAARAQAGSLVIPAWSFARGNARVYASPDQYADAGPVVGSGPEQPWGWRVEYDVDVPVTGKYTLQICYAAAEARPVEVFFDDQNLTKCCTGVTFGPASSEQPAEVTWNSSGAKWESVRNYFESPVSLSLTKGKHTVMFTRRGPLPHLVALRLDTPEAFPEDWKPPQYKVRDLDSIPAAYRTAFLAPGGVSDVVLRLPIEDATSPQAAGSFEIPAWTFDRGNARIYGSPDQYADAGPVVGDGPQPPEEGMVEYDIDFPATGEYTLTVSYAAAEARPVDVFLDGRNLGKCCQGITFGSAPFEHPVIFTWNSSGALKKWEGLSKQGQPVKLSVTQGKHTVKLARRGPLPHLVALRLDSSAAFPKDWKPPQYKVRNLDSVPAAHRAAFLPPGSVNVGALRLAIQDTMATFGPQYPDGEQYLKQLAELEAKQSAAEGGTADDKQKIEDALAALRRRAMLAHPELKFDKLLFLKRSGSGYGHTYADQNANEMGGNLCVLSPVSADGKVTSLVPELDGGLFDRFDLSFDARKVVFGYKKKDRPFHIYEIDIDPVAGKMVPGSLRQLTSVTADEVEVFKCKDMVRRSTSGGFDDMDPCYLPDGRIVFASTRSMRGVFCAAPSVTTLYVMDGDGKNMHCLSAGPINETAPSVMEDGRVIYTRWEYVDKGLGNGESLWAVRPDGSGSDHVYKNNTVRPAGMSNARGIPGSQKIVTIGGTHHTTAIGPVVLVDTHRSRRTTEAMTSITPELGYPCMWHATIKFGFFMDPYPFSEKLFLVSHTPNSNPGEPAGYGIYVLDGWGNRAELYRDPAVSCFEPIPLRPRRRPTAIASVAATDKAVARAGAADEEKTASLFIQDVYQGMTGIERGRVKYVRVMGALPWPWSERGMNWVGMHVDVHRKKVYGIVKVHEDGSAYFTVPAEENLFFQALDEDFMALQQMPTFINLMPGERRSCIGCHEPRGMAPSMAHGQPQALKHPPQTLVPQPGDTGPRMVHYNADVQPVLNKHCVGCHGGENPKGRLDLTGVPTEQYNRSYENFINKGLVSYADCRYGRSNFRAVPPLTRGSHLSKLTAQIRQDPCKANLTREEFVKIVTWIDANAPYYGTYRGKRDLKDKDQPDFRPPPLAGE